VLGPRAMQLEHSGSTSVPGLAAKPIIDMLLVVSDSADENAYVPALQSNGYVLRIREAEWHEHRMFKGPEADINLHVFSCGCPEIDRILLFRDWLRCNPADPRSLRAHQTRAGRKGMAGCRGVRRCEGQRDRGDLATGRNSLQSEVRSTVDSSPVGAIQMIGRFWLCRRQYGEPGSFWMRRCDTDIQVRLLRKATCSAVPRSPPRISQVRQNDCKRSVHGFSWREGSGL
jgi:GrpB protein